MSQAGAARPKVSFALDKRYWHPSPMIGQIVLVTTLNADGVSNVSPKSWISMMAFSLPTLVFGCNLQHWTAQNILRSGEFVVNIPGADLAAAAWRSHALPHPRPVEAAGLTPIPAERVKPPRIAECKAHLECVHDRNVLWGDEIALFGRIVAASLDRAALETADPYCRVRMRPGPRPPSASG